MEQKDIQLLQEQVRIQAAPLQLIKTEMGRIIAGQEKLIDRLLLALISDGHVLLEGVPGLAKTLAVKTLAQSLNGTFSRLQFTPDLLPADVIGTRIYNADTHEFSTRIGPVFANIVLADEINRAPAKVQSALLEAMQEKQVTIAGECFKLPAPFLVMATQNPIEQEGTYPLPEAQLDRFAMRLSLGYPSEEAEAEMLADRRSGDPADQLSPVIGGEEILELRRRAADVGMEQTVSNYLLELVRATRGEARLALGASPRAALVLAETARTAALLAGRDYVLPDEVRDLARVVLPHRLVLDSRSRYSGVTAAEIVEDLLGKIKIPR